MDPFEKKLRELPWRKPSPELQKRLFAPSKAVPDRRVTFKLVPFAAAAVVLISAAVLTHLLWNSTEAPSVAMMPSKEEPSAVTSHTILAPLEIAGSETFFDLSVGTNDAWSGALTLNVEPN